jgi:hypothetical protein
MEDLDAPNRDEFLVEAARAYRAREKCQLLLGRTAAAQADAKRADQLQAEAKKLAAKAKPSVAPAAGQVEIINSWTQPATVLIDGVAYRLEVGERKTLSRLPGPFTYVLAEGDGTRSQGTVEAGKTITIRVIAQQRGP